MQNVGPTITAWILSLSGIESSNFILQLLKPTSFTPVLALIGIIFFMFSGNSKKKDTGTILLGFATLMFGMDTMSSAVAGLADVPAFQNMFVMFQNPILGVLAGAILTAIIQSSSASGRNSSGTCSDRTDFIRSRNSDYYGTKYRHLYNRNYFICRRE